MQKFFLRTLIFTRLISDHLEAGSWCRNLGGLLNHHPQRVCSVSRTNTFSIGATLKGSFTVKLRALLTGAQDSLRELFQTLLLIRKQSMRKLY